MAIGVSLSCQMFIVHISNVKILTCKYIYGSIIRHLKKGLDWLVPAAHFSALCSALIGARGNRA